MGAPATLRFLSLLHQPSPPQTYQIQSTLATLQPEQLQQPTSWVAPAALAPTALTNKRMAQPWASPRLDCSSLGLPSGTGRADDDTMMMIGMGWEDHGME